MVFPTTFNISVGFIKYFQIVQIICLFSCEIFDVKSVSKSIKQIMVSKKMEFQHLLTRKSRGYSEVLEFFPIILRCPPAPVPNRIILGNWGSLRIHAPARLVGIHPSERPTAIQPAGTADRFGGVFFYTLGNAWRRGWVNYNISPTWIFLK